MIRKFKIGDEVMISDQYFIDKRKVDLPLYGKVVEIDKKSGKIRIEDKDGIKYFVDSMICDKDNITSMKEKDNDSMEEKNIKSLMSLIAKKVSSDDRKKRREAEDYIEQILFIEDDEKTRMINDLNLRRALFKYVDLATKKAEKEKDYDLNNYDLRKIIIENKQIDVEGLIDDFGIFAEIEFDEKQLKRLERSSLEKTAHGEGSFPVSRPKPISDLFGSLIALEAMKSILKEDEEKNKKNGTIHIEGLDDEDEDEDEFDSPLDDDDTSDSKDSFNIFDLFGGNNEGNMSKLENKSGKNKLPDCLIDMTELAKNGKYNDIIGREDEIDQVSETLARKEIRNPLLIGKPGAGKTAVVEELVKRAYQGKIKHLKNKHFYELRMNDLVAGTMYRGQLEQKLKDVMNVLENDPNVVLFIDEVHMIVNAGATANDKNDVSNALKPYLTSEISIIGATTFDEYRATFDNDGALARRFNPIVIEEKTKDEVVDIICKVKERFEDYHGVLLSTDMVSDIVEEIYNSKLDTSLIATAITAVDTICTKMKIKDMTEEEAFEKWSEEVVLGVDRTNKGGKTSKIGFDMVIQNKKEATIKENEEAEETDDLEILKALEKEIESDDYIEKVEDIDALLDELDKEESSEDEKVDDNYKKFRDAIKLWEESENEEDIPNEKIEEETREDEEEAEEESEDDDSLE